MEADLMSSSDFGSVRYNPPRTWWSRVKENAQIEITEYVGECAEEEIEIEDWDEL